jgi:hypothetical protein
VIDFVSQTINLILQILTAMICLLIAGRKAGNDQDYEYNSHLKIFI